MLRRLSVLIAVLTIALGATAASASPKTYFIVPGTFPEQTDHAAAFIEGDTLTLAKYAETSDFSAAGATIDDAAGDTISVLGFDYRGYCQGGAPRFNVFTGTPGVDPYYFVACNMGTQDEGFATFTATQGYNAFTGELTDLSTIEGISLVEIVQDEQGSVELRNIRINDSIVTMHSRPVPVTPPGIVITVDTSKCGQVTVTANGFGLHPGTGYQLVANNSVRAVTASLLNKVTATFTQAQAGEWGNAWIRTSAGGYLRTDFAWYHITRC